MTKNSNLYQLDGRVPLLQAVPFGLQHVLAMFVSNITPIIILANVVGLESSLSAALIQNCMIIAGIGTLIQLYPVWRIGSRLPIVMGISFTFLSLSIFIATTHGMGTLIAAVIVGGIVEGLLGLFAKYWIKIISPVVAATVVTAIGFSLLPIGANSFAGGQGAADFGAMHNWIVGTVTMLTCLGCQVFAKGFLRSLSVLVGLIVGYILAVCMGLLTTIPQAVLGGCTIIMFGSIMFAGFGMLAKCGFNDRNMVIVALSLSVGLGFTQATGMFSIFPQIIQTVFAENCVAVVFLLAVILNLILPK
ncbi:MAG: hypothetical protein IJ726_04690 [Phocaeicola sp.]|nr:hypothetical protein [Phocaeicola sp.]